MALFSKEKPENNNVEIDVYKSLKTNQLITWGLLALSSIVTISAFVFSYSTYSYQMNNVLILNEKGENVPMTWIARRDNIDVELKQNVNVWVDRFYNYDYIELGKAFSKDEEIKSHSKLELASWMITEVLFTKYKKVYNTWWNDVTRNNIRQEASIIPGTLQVTKEEPYTFKATLLIKVSKGEFKEFHEQQIAGKIVLATRDYPRNPHGMLITNYKESSRKQLNDYEEK